MGPDVVAVGTGNARHARHFIEERIPFPMLVEDDALAALRLLIGSTSSFAERM